jgi:hypothetical protein
MLIVHHLYMISDVTIDLLRLYLIIEIIQSLYRMIFDNSIIILKKDILIDRYKIRKRAGMVSILDF